MSRDGVCIAILPFALPEESDAGETWQRAVGLAAFLEDRLRRMPRTRLFAQHVVAVSESEPPTREVLLRQTLWTPEEALELPHPVGLAPTHLLQGRLDWGERVGLTLDLIAVSTRESCFRQHIECDAHGLPEQIGPLLGEMATILSPSLTARVRRAVARRPTASGVAFELHLRGLGQIVRDELLEGERGLPALDRFDPFLAALELDSTFHEPAHMLDLLASEYLNQEPTPQQLEAMVNLLRHATGLAQDEPNLLGLLGCLLAEQGKWSEAAPLLHQFVSGGRGRASLIRAAVARLAQAWRHAQQRTRARQLLEKGVERFPEDAALLGLLGRSHFEAQRLDAAEEALRRALAIEPRHSDALMVLGEIYWARRDFARARKLLEMAADNAGADSDALDRLCAFLLEMGMIARADEMATEWAETQPQEWRAWLCLAEARGRRGQLRAAEHSLGEAERLAVHRDTEGDVARVRFLVRHSIDAELYQRVRRAVPKPATPGEGPQAAEERMRRHQQGVLTTLQDLANRHPEAPFLWAALGERLADLGQHESAQAAWRRFLALLPRSAKGHNALACLLARMGHVAEAEHHFRLATRLAPHAAAYQVCLGSVLLGQGRDGLARMALNRAEALDCPPELLHPLREALEQRARFHVPAPVAPAHAAPESLFTTGLLRRLATLFLILAAT